MLRVMTMTAISIRDLTLIAAYAAFLVVYFGYFFFGFKRTVAGAAVLAGIVLIGLLPSVAALPALFTAFVALIALTTYFHNRATVFATSAVVLLRDSLAGRTGERLGGDRAREVAWSHRATLSWLPRLQTARVQDARRD
jgi:hypothetical protein